MSTVPVAETMDRIEANLWSGALREAGIRSAIIELGPGGALGGAVLLRGWVSYRIVVEEERVLDARNIIADLDGARALSPIREDDDDSGARGVIWLVGVGMVVVFAAGIGALIARLNA